MPRPRKRSTIHIGGQFEPDMATAFYNLTHAKGISMREGLRRVIIQAIMNGQIPGIQDMDMEHREREKWGNVVPTYSGEDEEPVRRRPASKVGPEPQPESSGA